jgi:hypothetical protein
MDDQRLREIYRFVVKNGFYSVGREKFLDTDITHDEMRELVIMACQGKGFESQDATGRA